MQRFQWPRGLLFLFCIAFAVAGPARAAAAEPLIATADEPPHWRLAVSPITHHFRFSAEHKPVWALGAERQSFDNYLFGATYFSNSFGQPSAYLYGGRRFEHVLGGDRFFTQISAGLLYGYKGKYQTKVPLNVNGYSPGLLFTAGWRFDERRSVALHLLGDAALMLQLSYEVP